jgi:hypothetical protein
MDYKIIKTVSAWLLLSAPALSFANEMVAERGPSAAETTSSADAVSPTDRKINVEVVPHEWFSGNIGGFGTYLLNPNWSATVRGGLVHQDWLRLNPGNGYEIGARGNYYPEGQGLKTGWVISAGVFFSHWQDEFRSDSSDFSGSFGAGFESRERANSLGVDTLGGYQIHWPIGINMRFMGGAQFLPVVQETRAIGGGATASETSSLHMTGEVVVGYTF